MGIGGENVQLIYRSFFTHHSPFTTSRYVEGAGEGAAGAGATVDGEGALYHFGAGEHVGNADAFALRLEEGELRRAVLANLCDEKGGDDGPAHSELWLDFAESMGSTRKLSGHAPVPEVRQLTAHFQRVASEASPEEALAAFYAYESQVPRVAREKERGLREMYLVEPVEVTVNVISCGAYASQIRS